MEFRVLGPLEVEDGGGPLQLGGPKQRSVLAHLILRSNHLVPAGLLIDELWGDEPPETARNTLQTYVYRLRKLIGDARIEAGPGGTSCAPNPTRSTPRDSKRWSKTRRAPWPQIPLPLLRH
ncbi:MAG: winged helix-turn-helix domain-containing protein [Actinomycetota bacterium]